MSWEWIEVLQWCFIVYLYFRKPTVTNVTNVTRRGEMRY